jgi:hypothetical protein
MGINLHPPASTPTTRNRDGNLNNNICGTGENANNNNGCGTRKRKYTVSDLPFGHWDVDSRKWRVCFVPSLLAWAGTQHDPFGTNSQMTDEVTALWKHVYPTIVLNDARMSIVLCVVCVFPELRPS